MRQFRSVILSTLLTLLFISNGVNAQSIGGPYVSDGNTMLLMHFDGNLTNSSTLSGDGTLQGSGASYSSYAPTNLQQCFNLDGSSYVTVPHSTNLDLTGDWTIEAWIKVTEFNSSTQSIIVRKPGDSDSYTSNYTLELHPWWGNILHGFYFSDAATRNQVTEFSPTLNKWYHVAFIRDAANSIMSIIIHDENWDIVSSSNQTYSATDMLLNSQDLRIGESYNGYIDELRISNVVRSFNAIPPPPFPEELDQVRIEKKINALNLHRMKFDNSPYRLTIDVLSSAEYEAQKPLDALPFDCGYVTDDGYVYVSEPTTAQQLEVFTDIDQAAIYYMCQSFLQYYYQTTEMPIWFKTGFASYESDMRLDDNDIKAAYNNYGGTLTSFDVLNNPITFAANNGFAVSYMFGEFLGVYKVWEYYGITVVNGTTIESNIGNAESIEKLFDMWLRYFNVRILEENEENRVKMGKETEHFKFYYRSSEEYWAAAFTDILEDALAEYMGLMEFEVFEKFSYFTMPECDGALLIEGVECINRYTGGTAWSSGLSSTSPDTDNSSDIERFRRLIRHELGHLTQSQLPQGTITQWLNEGYPSFMEGRPLTQEEIPQLQAATEQAIIDATSFFGHLPSFEETIIYAGSSYDYYLLGVILLNFIYEEGGYQAIKEIMIDYETGITNLGYSSLEAFMTAYYFYLDVRMLYKNVATLNTSMGDGLIYSSTLELNWTPLNPDVVLNVSYSIDGGIQWTEIKNNTIETNALLEFPADFYGEFYLKFSTPSILNFETKFGPFQRVNADIPTLLSQLGGEILIAGDIENIQWGYTNITTINIEYSNDNGVNWNEIVSGISGTLGNYEWVIPNENSKECIVKISDAANQANFDISKNTFKILTPNTAGGPYAVDDNTMLLIHFNGNLKNKSLLSDDGILNGTSVLYTLVDDNTNLGESINLDGSSYVTVPHNINLNLSGDWTIEAWINITAYPTSTSSIIVRKPGDTDSYYSNYAFEIHPLWGNILHGFYFPNAQTRINTTDMSPALNTWYHVAFIRDTGNSKISIIVHDENWDVVSTSSNTYATNDVLLNSQDIKIGESFTGYIDELRISNVVRDFTSVIEVDDRMTIPEEYVLHQNYPNPFNPSTMIQYGLPERSNVRIEVFNMLGQSVALLVNSEKSAGLFETIWDASNLPSGIYIISIRANGIDSEKNFVQVNKALLIK